MRKVIDRMKSALLGHAHPLHRHEDFRPFYVVGSGRSGTTLLRRILQASPQVHIPPETHPLAGAIALYRSSRHRDWAELVRRVFALFECDEYFQRAFGISLQPLLARLEKLVPGRRSLARMLDAFYRYHGEQTGQSFEKWGDKTPANTFAMSAIHAVFPRVQFVHTVRDGVDVVASMLEAKTTPALGTLDGAALRWKRSVAAARRFARRHRDACHEIRYEELVNHATETVAELCDFLSIRYDPRMTESLDHVREMGDVPIYGHLSKVTQPIGTGSVGRGRRELSRDDRARLQDLIGRQLSQLGYDSAIAGHAGGGV
ncbi:MAG: sulfotransferase family protein [Planctomycetota bacterium]